MARRNAEFLRENLGKKRFWRWKDRRWKWKEETRKKAKKTAKSRLAAQKRQKRDLESLFVFLSRGTNQTQTDLTDAMQLHIYSLLPNIFHSFSHSSSLPRLYSFYSLTSNFPAKTNTIRCPILLRFGQHSALIAHRHFPEKRRKNSGGKLIRKTVFDKKWLEKFRKEVKIEWNQWWASFREKRWCRIIWFVNSIRFKKTLFSLCSERLVN